MPEIGESLVNFYYLPVIVHGKNAIGCGFKNSSESRLALPKRPPYLIA
jgi:hypothetical protein